MLPGMRSTAAEMAAALGLEPHPEGGYYVETYRAAQTLRTPRGERPVATAILFLITRGSLSRLHRLTSDELWVFQGGLPLELVTIAGEGRLDVRVIGDVAEAACGATETTGVGPPGPLPQALVPAGSWQGARLAGGPHLPDDCAWALVSCVVTPGFDFRDFELGERDELLAAYPEHAEVIRELT